MMKRFLFFAALAAALAAGGVEKGMSRAAVLEELGAPQGSLQNNGQEILLFSTGTVTLKNGVVIASDLSEEYARRAEERDRRARAVQAARKAEQQRQQRIFPEGRISRAGCRYAQAEKWDYLPEGFRPHLRDSRYSIYIPEGYYGSGSRTYPCLFLESSAFWPPVENWVRNEKWIVVVLEDAARTEGGKLSGGFLAAYDHATRQFRIATPHRFILGRTAPALLATMRPVAGIILHEPDFRGLEAYSIDYLRQNPQLRAHAVLGDYNRQNTLYQGNIVIRNFPKRNRLDLYTGMTDQLPRPLAERALDWMKSECIPR